MVSSLLLCLDANCALTSEEVALKKNVEGEAFCRIQSKTAINFCNSFLA